MRALSFFILIFLTGEAFAQKPRQSKIDGNVLRSQSPLGQSTTNFSGLIELRPTLGTRKGTFSTENFYELAWGLSDNRRISLGEGIFTSKGANGNQEVSVGDAFIRYQWREIRKNETTGLVVSSEVRANLPVSQISRDAGLITAVRGSVIFSVPITTTSRFEFRETPIVYIYKEAGHQGSQGAIAHPLFENRVFLGPIVNLTEELTLTAPICFSVTRYRNYSAGANRNAQWVPDLSFNPEIDWAMNPTMYLGVAYRTEGFIVKQDSGVVVGDGAGNGSIQLVLGTSF